MPSLKVAQQSLENLSLKNKTFLIVGGTSGIGEAIALKSSSLGARVIVAGRNEQAGLDLEAESKSQKGSIEFKPLDFSLVDNAKDFAKSMSRENIDYLIISAGMARVGGRHETSEGFDDKMALHYFSRFSLIQSMAPILEKVAHDKGEARVMSVLAAAQGKLVDENDLNLKKNYGIKQCADACTFYNDLMVDVTL